MMNLKKMHCILHSTQKIKEKDQEKIKWLKKKISEHGKVKCFKVDALL
jgi:hypothetical protein